MDTLIEHKNATFLESSIRYHNPNLPLGWIAIALDGLRRKRVYLGMYYTDPETGKVVKVRSYSEDAKFIEKLSPGDTVNVVVHAPDWSTKDARTDVYGLAHIS